MKTYRELVTDIQQFLEEQHSREYYAWGWIDSTGKYIDGNPSPVTMHDGLARMYKLANTRAAIAKEWVRFFVSTRDKSPTFEFKATTNTIVHIKQFMDQHPELVYSYGHTINLEPRDKTLKYMKGFYGEYSPADVDGVLKKLAGTVRA
jgi:hypothetical protein